MLSTTQSFQSLLKEGYRHYQGKEEVILRNIVAAQAISELVKTSYGPHGMNKMVINHIGKLQVTNDAATILKEVEIQHPSASLIAMSAETQKQDFGDGTNFVVTLSGSLLQQAQLLIKSGLHPNDIISGFRKASTESMRVLKGLVVHEVKDVREDAKMHSVLQTVLASKLPETYKFFESMIYEGCLSVLDSKRQLEAEHFRVVKILGKTVQQSILHHGYVLQKQPHGAVSGPFKNIKVACYKAPFDITSGNTKGTVHITSPEQLLRFSSSEEEKVEAIVKGILEKGVKVVVVGGTVSDLFVHFFDKHGILVLKVLSKFELRRLAKCVRAVVIEKLGVPSEEELGFCEFVEVKEIGSTRVTVFNVDNSQGNVVTIVLRGATKAIMENIEKTIQNALEVFRATLRDGKFVYGGGSVESYLQNYLEQKGSQLTTLDQYSYQKFGTAFEIFGRMLLENAGLVANNTLSDLL